MSQQLIPSPADCCSPCCEPEVVNIPGPQGPAGDPCDPCSDGENAWTQAADVSPTAQPVMPYPIQVFSTTIAIGSPTAVLASTATIVAGMDVSGTGIPAATTVLNVVNGTDITLSANATAAGAQSITYTQSVVVTTTSSTDFLIGTEIAYVENWGYLLVVSVPSSTTVKLRNIEDAAGHYAENVAQGTSLAALSKIVPSGLQGLDGVTPAGALLIANNLSDVANTATSRTNLGLGSAAVLTAAQVFQVANNLSEGVGATKRTNLGLAIGINVQAQDATLQSLAALGTVADRIAYTTAVDTWAETPLTAVARTVIDDTTTAAMRATLLLNPVPTDWILIREEQASGVNGGTGISVNFVSGAWRTRALNTESVDTGGYATLAAFQITLQAGTYRFRAMGVGVRCNQHQVRLQNITAGTTVAFGLVNTADSANQVSNAVDVNGRFTIAAPTVLELQHQCVTTRNGDGFGLAAGFGNIEVYASIAFEREAG